MTDAALVAFLELVVDDDAFRNAERMVGVQVVPPIDLDLDPSRLDRIAASCASPDEALDLAREWYAEIVDRAMSGDEPTTITPGSRSFIAYVAAAYAARADWLHEAKRWLHVGHAEAEADGLGAEELHVLLAAVRTARG